MVKDNSKSAQEKGVSKRKQWWRRRSKLEKKLILSLFVSILLLVGFFLYVTYKTAETVKPCTTPSCLVAASQIISHIDSTIDPCDDFFKFACGKFIEHTHGDMKAATIKELEEQVERQVSEIIQEPINDNDHYVIRNQKELFQACMNESSVEEESLDIFAELLDHMNGWPVVIGYTWKQRRFNWMNFVYKLRRRGYLFSYMLDVDVLPDPEDTKKFIVYVSEPYIKTIKKENKELYKQYMTDVAVTFGAEEEYAKVEMENVLDFMDRMKKVADLNDWDNENGNETERNRTAELLATKFTIEEFQDQYDYIDWLSFINNILYPVANISSNDYVIFPRGEFVEDFFTLINKTPKKIKANYMIWNIVELLMPFFPSKIQKLRDNYECVTDSSPPTKERFPFCKAMISRSIFPTPTNIIYARNYLPAGKKDHVQGIVRNVKSEFITLLGETSWMDDESKEKAVVKAEAIIDIIGAPGDYFSDDVFEMYEFDKYFQDNADNRTFFTIFLNLMKLKADVMFSQINKKPDNDSSLDIFYQVLTRVNAMYSPEDNAIILPVGILQGIFYNQNRPMYLNYGALGSIVGHELTHAFCKDASKFDKNGKEANMWTNKTEIAYDEKTKCIVEDAENYDVEDTENTINGTLTMEENIADFTGIKVSYAAYKKYVQENGEEPELTGIDYTPYQLFWISAILHECYKLSGEKLERSLENDLHALNAFRATGPMRNNPDFSNDFNCPEDSKMNPKEKCQVF